MYMANSLPSKHPWRLAAALAAGLLGVAAAAQAPRSTEKIVLDAVPVEIDTRKNTAVLRDVVITQGETRIQANEARVKGGLDFQNGEWTISGDVRIKAEGGSLRSDKAVVAFRNNLISRATITGAPAEFEQLRTDGTTAHGRANTIDYETSSGMVSFREDAWLTFGCNEITGQQFAYNLKTQSFQGQDQQPAGTRIGRVTFTIQPGASSGKPCAGKAAEPKP
jgi:lipopolysaccharide transport protein LptA